MHNKDELDVKTERDLAFELLDNPKALKATQMNNFELRKLKESVKSTSVMSKTDINALNMSLRMPLYQSTAKRAKLSTSKYLVEVNSHSNSVLVNGELREEGNRGYYKTPFYNSPCVFHCIHPGARFEGFQVSGPVNYKVQVTIQDVDLDKSYLSGFLTIEGITQAYSKLTTYFDSEMIGKDYSFLTRKWQTNEEIDILHWNKFPSFRAYKYEKVMNNENFVYDPRLNGDFLYFRFKEHFLVPDHKVSNIPGASYAGFYYICIQISTQKMDGFYYHSSSQWYQRLELKYTSPKSISQFEFR